MAIEQDALADLHRAVLALISAAGSTGDRASITLDLQAVVTALDARLDPDDSGFLGQPIPADLGTLTLVESDGLRSLARLVQILEALRWLLPALCAMSALFVLLLARARLHAIAWLGLCLLLVGAACLLAASSAPLIAGRLLGSRADTIASMEATLDGLMGGLITQSAVLAGRGARDAGRGCHRGHGDRPGRWARPSRRRVWLICPLGRRPAILRAFPPGRGHPGRAAAHVRRIESRPPLTAEPGIPSPEPRLVRARRRWKRDRRAR